MGTKAKVLSVAVLLMLACPWAVPSAFGAELCQQFAFSGQVKGRQSFFRPIGMGLSFRMLPSTTVGGWSFEIGPTHPNKGEFDMYIYAVTPPYRGRLATMLDTQYATLAQDAVKGGSDFWFLLHRADGPRASAALDQVLWPDSGAAQDKAMHVLAALAKGHGELRIVAADIVPGTAKPGTVDPHAFYGAIKRIAFNVQLVVPKSFVPAPGLRAAPATCPDSKDWLTKG